MISHVARDQKEWIKAGYTCVPISVNVSRAHFIENDLAEQIRDMVDEAVVTVVLALEGTFPLVALRHDVGVAGAVHVPDYVDEYPDLEDLRRFLYRRIFQLYRQRSRRGRTQLHHQRSQGQKPAQLRC